jgi:HAMP domain-containing protein
MNIFELKEKLDRIILTSNEASRLRVVIPIKTTGSVGGTPCVDIKSAIAGFDWDDGKLMLYPVEDLSRTDHDYLAKIRKQADEIGWSVSKFQSLKRENKRLLEELKQLKGEE